VVRFRTGFHLGWQKHPLAGLLLIEQAIGFLGFIQLPLVGALSSMDAPLIASVFDD
jgi:hypothetical protein